MLDQITGYNYLIDQDFVDSSELRFMVGVMEAI